MRTGWTLLAMAAVWLLVALDAAAEGRDPASLPGIVVDDPQAELTGDWTSSTHTKPFIGEGYLHDGNRGKGEKSARFNLEVTEPGEYHVRLSYTAGNNRASNVPVEIHHAGGVAKVQLDQRQSPPNGFTFRTVGTYQFEAGLAAIVIGNAGTDGHVIVDSVMLQPSNGNPPPDAPEPPIVRREKPEPVEKLTSEALDALIAAQLNGTPLAEPVDDERFLRRLSLDLIGRPPTPDELDAYINDASPNRRAAAIDRMLADESFGRHWANYWSDVIAYRTPQLELTFFNYNTFKTWLAERLNDGAAWDDVVYDILTAEGKVKDNPEATFIGFHNADPVRLAGETTRVFLAVQLSCAECHDHPFEDWSREQFHGMAAFFARSNAKIARNNSDNIEVLSRSGGQYHLPDEKDPSKKGDAMAPIVLTGDSVELAASDLKRRAMLADWLTEPKNRWFARSYVNRIWGRMMGRAFVEPVDNLAEDGALWREVHEQLADHFAAGNYDVKGLFRLIAGTQAYQRGLSSELPPRDAPWAIAEPQPLAGDQVFQSLATTIRLPNTPGERIKATKQFRFPPPPKSTRDLVDDAFGFDPSIDSRRVQRDMPQAMWMMNNEQLHAQIDADPESGTLLAEIVASESDDAKAVAKLYRSVLARRPTEKEAKIALDHIQEMNDRGEAFEDLLWSLINSAEFTSKP